MNSQTRYRYEDRIKNLQKELDRLRPYELLCRDILFWITENRSNGNSTNEHWLLQQFSRVFK